MSNKYMSQAMLELADKDCSTLIKAEDNNTNTLYLLLLLYYALKANIPASIKVIILGAVCWFISPVDAIPDYIPLFGYTDDLSALLFAKHKAEQYIDIDVNNQAKEKLAQFKEVIR